MFRDKNKQGFIKAFTDEPESLAFGLGKIDRLMKSLYLQKLYLYPRFQSAVVNTFSQIQPVVYEEHVALTENMITVQRLVE